MRLIALRLPEWLRKIFVSRCLSILNTSCYLLFVLFLVLPRLLPELELLDDAVVLQLKTCGLRFEGSGADLDFSGE